MIDTNNVVAHLMSKSFPKATVKSPKFWFFVGDVPTEYFMRMPDEEHTTGVHCSFVTMQEPLREMKTTLTNFVDELRLSSRSVLRQMKLLCMSEHCCSPSMDKFIACPEKVDEFVQQLRVYMVETKNPMFPVLDFVEIYLDTVSMSVRVRVVPSYVGICKAAREHSFPLFDAMQV